MRTRDSAPPRWRSIFLLAGIALSIGAATYYSDPPSKQRTNRDPGREAPAALAKGARSGGGPAPPERPLTPGPIASQEVQALASGGASPPAFPAQGDAPPLSRAAREIPRLAEELGRPVSVVSAQVIDPAGRPIPGVQVALGDREAVSDSQGEVVLPQKSADLLLRHPDHFPRVIDPELRRGISIPDGEKDCERLILVMFPGGRVAGRIVEAGGKPVALAQVTTNGEESGAVTTDSKGEFRSPILRPGVHHLFVFHPDFQRADGSVTIPAGGGEVPFTMVLRPGVRHELRTVDAAGAPVPDAGVWLVQRSPGGTEDSRFAGRTGDDGRLVLLWDPGDPHSVSVRVIVPGFREELHPLSGGQTVVALERAPLISGQVIDRDRGLPVKPSEIVLEIETREGFSRAPDRGVLFRTLAAGKFRVGLPPFPGVYRVRALAEGDLSGTSDRILFDGRKDPPAATVHLVQRTSLRGQVVAAREGHPEELAKGGPSGSGTEPIAQARVELHRHDLTEALRLAYGVWFAAPPGPVRAFSTDAGGGFTFKDLNPGVYRVRVVHGEFADWLSAPVTVPLEAPLPCVLRAGAVLRGVVYGSSGAPEADIPLVLAPQGNPFTSFTRTDEAGRYEFRNLAEGAYFLFTGDPRAEGSQAVQTRPANPLLPVGQRERSHPIAIRAGQELTFDVRRESRELGGLAGKVSTDGAPLAGVSIRVTPSGAPAKAGDPAAGAPSKGDPGDAGEEEAGAGPSPGQEEVPPPGENSRPDLLAGGSGAGPSGPGPLMAEGSPAAGPREDPPPPEFEITTGPDGVFRLDGLEPGRYRIAGSGLPLEETIEVAGGKMTELQIGLKTMCYRAVLLDGLLGKPVQAEGRAEIAAETKGETRTLSVESGRVAAAGLYPGKYRIRLKLPGYLPFEGRFEITPNAPGGTLSQELRLRPGNTLRVAVIGGDDQPYHGKGETVLLRKDGVEIHRSYGEIEGEVLLPVLPAGSYLLNIRTEDGSTRMELEVARDARVDARLGSR